jgi:hypothetical protein
VIHLDPAWDPIDYLQMAAGIADRADAGALLAGRIGGRKSGLWPSSGEGIPSPDEGNTRSGRMAGGVR